MERNVLPFTYATIEDATNGEAPDIIVVVQRGDQKLQRLLWIVGWRGHGLENGLKEGSEVGFFTVGFRAAATRFGIAIIHGEIKLRFRGIKIDKQIVDFI